MGVGHPAGFQHALDRPFGQGQRTGIRGLLVLRQHVAQLLPHRLNHLHAALFLQRVPQHTLKRLLLDLCGHRRFTVKDGLYKALVGLPGILGV